MNYFPPLDDIPYPSPKQNPSHHFHVLIRNCKRHIQTKVYTHCGKYLQPEELETETMAATVSSPWGKPGAWALDAEEHESELAQQLEKQPQLKPDLPGDFPSLSAAVATKPKKKNKGQTLSLAEFSSYSSVKPATQPDRLTTDELLSLPTGPRERSDEELDRSRLGGGFKSYGMSSRYGDDSSNSKWGSSASRVSDEGRRERGGFNRDAGRESTPSRADETDNWATGKRSTMGNGFERRERGGFFESQSKADESDNWVSNRSSEVRRFGSTNGGGFDRRGSFDSLSRSNELSIGGGGADSDNWGQKKKESTGTVAGGRPRLVLQPRSLPVSEEKPEESVTQEKPKGANPFGNARPREEVLKEKGKDWKEIDEKLESNKIKDPVMEKGDGSFRRRGFGIGNGRYDDERDDRSWRKSEEKTLNNLVTEEEEKNKELEDTNTNVHTEQD